MSKTKLKKTNLKEFPGCWWLFWMQHFSRYGARLVELRKKEEDDQFCMILDRFRLVILEQVLDTITVTVDRGKLYKLI